LFEKIDGQKISNVAWYSKQDFPAIPVPVLGPDLIDLRRVPHKEQSNS
jgi:hypothetical protein